MKRLLFSLFRRVLGDGWAYRFPSSYQRVISQRFGDVRDEAFAHVSRSRAAELSDAGTCVDIACGTGITTTWMATHFDRMRILGVDASSSMLRVARRLARKQGVDDRCVFLKRDALTMSSSDLRAVLEDESGRADVITCSLGFSVMPDWEETFRNTLGLLKDDGSYLIFDQYIPGLVLPAFQADQSRRSWELIEEHFVESEVKWFGKMFIAFGHGKRPDKASREVGSLEPETIGRS